MRRTLVCCVWYSPLVQSDHLTEASGHLVSLHSSPLALVSQAGLAVRLCLPCGGLVVRRSLLACCPAETLVVRGE